MPQQYYDDQGNPIPAAPKTKYYDYEGNLIEDKLPIQEVKPLSPKTGIVLRGKEGSGYQTSQQEKLGQGNTWIPPVPAGSFGRGAAEVPPFVGSLYGGPLGTIAGSIIKQGAKRWAPGIFGESSPNIYDQAGEVGKDLLFNEVLPRGLSKIGGAIYNAGRVPPRVRMGLTFSNLPAARNALLERMTEQVHGMLPEYRPRGFGEYQPMQFQETEVPFQPIKITDVPPRPTVAAKGDITMVPGGVMGMPEGRIVTGDEHLSDFISGRRINAGRALDELMGRNTSLYRDSFAPGGFEDMRDLLQTMEKMQATGAKADKVINYYGGRLVWSAVGGVAGGLLGHGVGAGVGGGAGIVGPIVLNRYIGQLMSNRGTANLVIQAMRTPANSAEGQFLNKALTSYLPRLAQIGADVATIPEK